MQDGGDTRPKTPESPLANSLHHASTTIDDLTLALASFSRLPSPEPPFSGTCCCGREDCGHAKAWLTFKSNLESRLVLSAEVGQALLQKHEAYVRRHEGRYARDRSVKDSQIEPTNDSNISLETQERTDTLIDELTNEKAALEKRLNQALVNNEVAEVSHKTVLHELHEARAAISRLTAHHARSIGWDTRLKAVMEERDDMQQERDAEAQKARQAEGRITALKARASKLESEVQRLQKGLEERRLHRLESSESILQDARARLEVLQNSQLGHTAMTEEAEIMKVLESLVSDNEGLKRDNAELQRLLKESREEYHTLQEENEEQCASLPSRVSTPHLKSLFLTAGGIGSGVTSPTRRNASADASYRHPFDESDQRAFPSHSPSPSETKWTALGHPQSHYPASRISLELEDGHCEVVPPSPEKAQPYKPLYLLSRSRGVQTDTSPVQSPPPISLPALSPSPHDPRSESSSLTDSVASNMSILVERVALLLHRMTQADALTLTNRLKRQHLKGADVGHLSRTTVSGIISDAGNLRNQFRALLEDDKVVTTCTRKDLRGLFKLFKETFAEMGEMRVTLNDVILDPSIASKVREMALHPTKAGSGTSDHSSSGGWMAPISKLFGSAVGEGVAANHDVSPPERGRAKSRPRVIPKLGPALAASATTVNVEFSGSGVGRAVTNTLKAREGDMNNALVSAASNGSYHTSTNLMGIFAGAPRSDPWVVLPKGPLESPGSSDALSPMSFAKSTVRMRGTNRLSRHVDAVIDVSSPNEGEESDRLSPLLARTLRRRGLSDSSIHSTFVSQAADEGEALSHVGPGAMGGIGPDRGSVLQTLTRTVRNFRLTTPGPEIQSAPQVNARSDAGRSSSQQLNSSANATSSAAIKINQSRAPAPLSALLPHFSSWAGSGGGDGPLHVGSIPSESLLTRQSRTHGRDYF